MVSNMRSETLVSASIIEKILTEDRQVYRDLSHRLKKRPPESLLSLARGSSANAASYFDYLAMARIGIPAMSLPMSLFTLYNITSMGSLLTPAFIFSQSGQSPDLLKTALILKDNGSLTAAIVNDVNSPIAKACHWILPLHCGEEKSVVATKSYIAQLFVSARIIAEWKDDIDLKTALNTVPSAIEKAIAFGDKEWNNLSDCFANAKQLTIIGRGTSHNVAFEGALKIQETCTIAAEAYSGAEFKHGAIAIVNQDYPVLIIAPRGPAQKSLLQLAGEIREYGGKVLVATSPELKDCDLPIAETGHYELDPITTIVSLYLAIEKLAIAKGYNPDEPAHMTKAVKTS